MNKKRKSTERCVRILWNDFLNTSSWYSLPTRGWILTVVSSSCNTWSYSLMATQNIMAVTSSKQWIHFFLSDLCPPTSNNLQGQPMLRHKLTPMFRKLSYLLPGCIGISYYRCVQNFQSQYFIYMLWSIANFSDLKSSSCSKYSYCFRWEKLNYINQCIWNNIFFWY